MLKCPSASAVEGQHLLHTASGMCLLCQQQVLEPLAGAQRPRMPQLGASGATGTKNVPQPIPLKSIFPNISPSWAPDK